MVDHWMRRLRRAAAVWPLLLGLLLGLPGAAWAQQAVPLDAQGRPLFKADEVLVQLKPGMTPASLGNPANRLAVATHALGRAHGGALAQLVRLGSGSSVAQALDQLRADPAVQAASPNYYNYPLITVPSDPYYNSQWGLHNIAQDLYSAVIPLCTTMTCFPDTGRVAGDDIDAERAWDLATGTGQLVAVIDTGVDYGHPDLTNQMWSGTGGANCPGTSLPPTLHGGCDITNANNDPAPMVWDDISTHGTHVAGIIAAQENNSAGGVGVAFNARIMALQVFPDYTTPSSAYGASDGDIITAINYAAANGADIVNMSLGRGGPEDPVMTSAIQSAIAKGVLFVVAAGNQGSSNDVVPEWPANYASVGATNEGVISVAATDQADQYASFSNYGAASVTIAAPGYNILSTVHIGVTPGYGYESGTSMASPMTAGVAALVRQAFPAFTPGEVKQRIVAAGEAISSSCVTASDKRVNAYNALAGIVSPTPCGAIAALTRSGGSGAPCLITYLTQDYLPDRDLDPLRHVRSFLWSQGEWGRALVRFYYRASARIVAWLETARAETFARRVTTTI